MDPKTDVVAAAYATCKVIQSSGYAPECEVSGWNGTVDAVIDTSSSEARKICAGMVELVAVQTRAFSSAGRIWQLRIFSPYSGDHPVAVCHLR
jgi:hypothetical protein